MEERNPEPFVHDGHVCGVTSYIGEEESRHDQRRYDRRCNRYFFKPSDAASRDLRRSAAAGVLFSCSTRSIRLAFVTSKDSGRFDEG